MKIMKKMFVAVSLVLATACIAFADDNNQKYCPFGGTPRYATEQDHSNRVQTTTIQNDCSSSSSTQNSGQNNWNASGKGTAETGSLTKTVVGASGSIGGGYERKGETSSTTNSSSSCTSTTIKYVCE